MTLRLPPSFFPPAESADRHGLVAVTDEMTPDLVLDAYCHGIFPWSEGPVGWFSPEPRAIFERDKIRLPGNLKRLQRQAGFRATCDQAFGAVMRACATAHAASGTWITDGFLNSYGALHEHGFAHSVEIWQAEQLVGGIYGVQVNGLFAGESMFHTVSNASKVAFAHLVAQLDLLGVVLFDAQVPNDFTVGLGAVSIRRKEYLARLKRALATPSACSGSPWPSPPPSPFSDRNT
ncbi:MAG TPA: leucyl/phenylalanyl-tRNA--protein transferase [Candidatus Paceibacterota bacterium]|nr:leucyl/phenylalanyl-tRNA--protein transferase [Candidatus Paceibacterota bacterium]